MIFQTGNTALRVWLWFWPHINGACPLTGSISSRALQHFTVDLHTHFDGSGAGLGGEGNDEGISMQTSKTGDDGGGASEKSKLFSFE